MPSRIFWRPASRRVFIPVIHVIMGLVIGFIVVSMLLARSARYAAVADKSHLDPILKETGCHSWLQ